MASFERDMLVKKSLKGFLLIFLLLGSLLGGMVLVFYQLQTRSYDSRLSAEEEHTVRLQREIGRNLLTSIFSDLVFLTRQEDLKTYLSEPSEFNRSFVNNEYLTLSKSKKVYDQIRYLDAGGQEVARVNYNNGSPAVVAKNDLQNKQKRYYFSDTFRLDRGEVFVSPLDLNIEHGQVESPYKPMLRFGMPVFDESGKKRGIVLLNYLADHLLQAIQEFGSIARGQTMLLNADGYWLKHPDVRKEWGFMFAHKAHHRFSEQQPQLWAQMLEAPSGQIRTPQGIYTFTTISPLGMDAISSTGAAEAFSPSERMVDSDEYFWKIVSFISPETLSSYSHGMVVNIFGLGIGLFLITGILSWFLALALTRRKLYQAQLLSLAHFDNLTGLPNRTLFFDRLEQSINHAKRYARTCALLYIDLDGFKEVNDKLGHDAGDAVLVAVGKRLGECCRSVDTVARLGGDEFAILFSEISDSQSVEQVAEKILLAVQEPYTLPQGKIQISASVGIGLFPEHGITSDQLIKSADEAMYRAKHEGKNKYRVYK